jgi:hypothetical protein
MCGQGFSLVAGRDRAGVQRHAGCCAAGGVADCARAVIGSVYLQGNAACRANNAKPPAVWCRVSG